MTTREIGTEPTVILVTADHLGADRELGTILMKGFLNTLAQAASKPARMVFLNTGVHLTTRGSPVLDTIAELEAGGGEILSCGTCLDFLGKKEELEVGRVTNMHDTVKTVTGAWRLVTIG